MIASIAPNDREAAIDDTWPRTRWRRTGWLALPVVAVAAALVVIDRDGPAVTALPAQAVTAAPQPVRDVSERDDDVGRIRASKSVAVTAPDAVPAIGGEAFFAR